MAKKKEVTPSHEPQEAQIGKKYYDVAKFLRKKLPEKTTSLLGHKVNYFIGRKAVDALMESKLKDQLELQGRNDCCYLLEEMIAYKFFHRARKIAMDVSKLKKKKKENEEEEEVSETPGTPKATPRAEKGKKKFKLDMHHEQIFVDSNEPYVWIYDPIPLRTWVLGTLLVVAAIAVCMFPLWPRTMRDGVYYLSMAAACFLGVILGLAVVRQILFVIIFVFSFGKHRLWILPNLTEDVGFFESFVPLYSYEFCGETVEDKKKSKEKKSKSGDNSSKASSSKEQGTGSEDSDFEMVDPLDVKKDQ